MVAKKVEEDQEFKAMQGFWLGWATRETLSENYSFWLLYPVFTNEESEVGAAKPVSEPRD